MRIAKERLYVFRSVKSQRLRYCFFDASVNLARFGLVPTAKAKYDTTVVEPADLVLNHAQMFLQCKNEQPSSS